MSQFCEAPFSICDLISRFTNHEKYFTPFIETRTFLHRNDSIIVVIGSGLSMPHCPSWFDMLDGFIHLCKKAGNLPKSSMLQKMKGRSWNDLTIKGQIIRNCFIDNSMFDLWDRYIRETFLMRTITIQTELLAKFIQTYKNYLIISMNYDDQIERLLEGCNIITYNSENVDQEILRWSKGYNNLILKLHGCASDPANIIFSRTDYIKLTIGYQKLWKTLSAELLTKRNDHILGLILGYSISDPDVIDFIETTRYVERTSFIQNDGMTSKIYDYPVFYWVYDSSSRDRNKDIYKIYRQFNWQLYSIVDIPYFDQKHEELQRFLEILITLRTQRKRQ